MKRSPIARRSQLRRSAMKRTRKTPRHQDPDFRREYKLRNREDEWTRRLGIKLGLNIKLEGEWPEECNHIWTAPRRDGLPYIITLSKRHHLWFHAHIDAGRVLSMLVKCLKEEADIAAWGVAAGSASKPRPIRSWVESLDFRDMRWMLRYRDWLLVLLLDLERKSDVPHP